MMRQKPTNSDISHYASEAGAAPEAYDVIVVGLGTAGAIAAIAAARKGLRVLGIDRHTCMGGAGTAGGVLGYYFGKRGGLFEEIDAKVQQTEKSVYTPSYGVGAEGKQYVLEQEAVLAGAVIRYDTTVTGVLTEGRTVTGLRCFSPELGSRTVMSKVVIDGTGNADVCRLGGCELQGGREFDDQPQPFSNALFKLDGNRVRAYYTDSGYVFPEDPHSMSAAIIDSALLSTHLMDRYDDGTTYMRIAPQLGVRESRFIVGEEQVTLERFLREDYSREPLFMAYSNLDNHSKDVAFESELQRDWTVAASLWGLKFTVPIPLGALIPKGYDGLLATGRCIALDHDMASLVRMKRDMQKSGEAAAYAAYLAITGGVPLRDVPYPELARLLREAGCLEEGEKVYFEHRVAQADAAHAPIRWLEDPADIREALSGVKPGVAIWSAKRLGETIRGHLLQWIGPAEPEHLRRHSAMALALMGAREAAPILREMVRERDPFVPQTSLKYNQARGYAAVYLLGRLADKEAVPLLLDLLESREGFTFIDGNKEFLSDEADLRFQYVSYALMALAAIGSRHEETRPAIADAFGRFERELDGTLVISFKGSSEIRNVMDDKIRKLIDRTIRAWQSPAGVL
ncbi:FAD-dependent oxidoreductase [Paenibacillus sp. GCM10012303]|uniref:FAD-dependent oxidoreductase n=1 Tax=Paenibacillus sp. GCM10012303 TaxID=3317340 RepID=UPI003611F290